VIQGKNNKKNLNNTEINSEINLKLNFKLKQTFLSKKTKIISLLEKYRAT
jgi:hypothetical protein